MTYDLTISFAQIRKSAPLAFRQIYAPSPDRHLVHEARQAVSACLAICRIFMKTRDHAAVAFRPCTRRQPPKTVNTQSFRLHSTRCRSRNHRHIREKPIDEHSAALSVFLTRPKALFTYTGAQRRCRCQNQARRSSASVWPIRAGEGDTLMPAASIAATLCSASPLPPEMMAPA